jgi:hypothetical protein
LRLSEWTAKKTHWVPPLWMAADAALDLTLLVCMCVSLFSQRTGLQRWVIQLMFALFPVKTRLDIRFYKAPIGSSSACYAIVYILGS